MFFAIIDGITTDTVVNTNPDAVIVAKVDTTMFETAYYFLDAG